MKLLAKVTLAAVLFSGFANAGVVVVANPSGPDALTKSQVTKLFLGKSKKLPTGARAEVLEQTNGSATRIEFHNAVTGKSEAQLQSYWSRLVFTGKGKAPKALASSAQVKSKVAGSANAIGYIDEADLDGTVKVVFKP